jgi:hypothetical protein
VPASSLVSQVLAAAKAMHRTFIMIIHFALWAVNHAKLVKTAIVTLNANTLAHVATCHDRQLRHKLPKIPARYYLLVNEP